MKKISAILLSAMLVLSLCACGGKKDDEPKAVSAEMNVSTEVSTEVSEETSTEVSKEEIDVASTEISEETSTEISVEPEVPEVPETSTESSDSEWESVEDWINNGDGAALMDQALEIAKKGLGSTFIDIYYECEGNVFEFVYILNMELSDEQAEAFADALNQQSETYETAAETERNAISTATGIDPDDIYIVFTFVDLNNKEVWSNLY